MIVLGLAGQAGAGKDTVADYLAARYGFQVFSFSDALYHEVAAAFGLPDESLLRDRATKDTPSAQLCAENCSDGSFLHVIVALSGGPKGGDEPLSPRQILQWWGAEYRRAQNPDYWIEKADRWIYDLWAMFQYPEQRPQLFVNTSVRFANEQAFIHKFTCGNVWHIRREGHGPANGHVSETPLPMLPYERQLFNNDSIDRLHRGIELLLSTQAEFVRVEPMLPYDPTQPQKED